MYLATHHRAPIQSKDLVHKVNASISFISKPIEDNKQLEPAVRKRKLKSLEQQNHYVHPEAKAQYKITSNDKPIRQYFHSRTNLPISEKEWDEGFDSDDEHDNLWIRKLGERVSFIGCFLNSKKNYGISEQDFFL